MGKEKMQLGNAEASLLQCLVLNLNFFEFKNSVISSVMLLRYKNKLLTKWQIFPLIYFLNNKIK